MILEVFWDGLWTLSFGISQFHGHGSWLACEVALNHRCSRWAWKFVFWFKSRLLSADSKISPCGICNLRDGAPIVLLYEFVRIFCITTLKKIVSKKPSWCSIEFDVLSFLSCTQFQQQNFSSMHNQAPKFCSCLLHKIFLLELVHCLIYLPYIIGHNFK